MAGTSPAMTWLYVCTISTIDVRRMTDTAWPNLRESDFIRSEEHTV